MDDGGDHGLWRIPLSEFSGRLNDGSYPAIINSLARASRLPSRGKACFNSYGEPLANFYVYGASFHQYLAKTYGEDKFSRLYELNSSSIAAYLNPLFSTPGLERAFRLTYGKALEQLWQEWIQDATANSFPLPEMKLTSDGWVKKKLRTDSGSLYYIQRQSEKTGPASSFTSHSLSRLDPGSDSPPQVLIRQNSDFPAGYQITPDKIYFSRAEWQTGFDNNDFDGLGVITEVWEADLSGASRKKLFSGNIRAFCHLENELLLTAEDDLTHQGSEIYEVSTTTGAKRLLGHLDYLISGLQVHNGQIFVSARGFWKNNSIYLLDTFNFRLIPLIDTPYAETLVSVDAGGLIFNANYGGRNGSYHYDLDSKKLTRFSGCEELSDAVCLGSDTYFLSLDAGGYDIYADSLVFAPCEFPAKIAPDAPYSRLDASADTVLGNIPLRQGSYLDNLKHLVNPRVLRLPYLSSSSGAADSLISLDDMVIGVQLAGADATGDIPIWTASLAWDLAEKRPRWQLDLENKFFHPVKQTLSYSNFAGHSLSSRQYIPLLQRMNYGLSYAAAGFGLSATENFARKVWDPFLELNLAVPGLQLSSSNRIMLESTRFLPSDRDRLGWQGNLNLRWRAPWSSEIRGKLSAAWDPDADSLEVFPPLRGYGNSISQNTGIRCGLSWYAPVFKVRNGFWNPNLYLGDINLGLFMDYSRGRFFDPSSGAILADNDLYSWGAELITEISAGYLLSFNAGIRLAFRKDSSKPSLELILGL